MLKQGYSGMVSSKKAYIVVGTWTYVVLALGIFFILFIIFKEAILNKIFG